MVSHLTNSLCNISASVPCGKQAIRYHQAKKKIHCFHLKSVTRERTGRIKCNFVQAWVFGRQTGVMTVVTAALRVPQSKGLQCKSIISLIRQMFSSRSANVSFKATVFSKKRKIRLRRFLNKTLPKFNEDQTVSLTFLSWHTSCTFLWKDKY